MSIKYRIKEIVVNKDGTNIWFYPQECEIIKKKRFLKPAIETEAWYNFYEKRKDGTIECINPEKFEWAEKHAIIQGYLNVVGFRDLEDAKRWLDSYIDIEKKKMEAYREKYYKNLAAEVPEADKIHEVKI